MKTIELFGKQVELRENDCIFYDGKQQKFNDNRANLFIQLTNRCNAACKFCEYHGIDKSDFDYDKLKIIIKELASKLNIRKLNLTGGEPTIDMERFDKVFSICLSSIQKETTEVTVNTNGIHLLELLDYIKYIDSIGLSRHHYSDELNYEIFGSKTIASSEDIIRFQEKSTNNYILHGRCNLIKGYIDCKNEMLKYLNNCADLNILWAGFVTLMPLNKFCIDNEVCSNTLISDDNFYRNQLWHRLEEGKVECQCADYLYTSPNGKIITFYNRIFCNNNLYAGQLVFDGQYLRRGFSGEIII